MPLITKAIRDNREKPASSSGSSFLNPGSLNDGEDVRFTILGDQSAHGYELWLETDEILPSGKKKVVKTRFTEEPSPADIAERAKELGATAMPERKPKMFYAFAVWNYEQERVQLFEFSQQTISEPLITSLMDEEVEAEPHLSDFKLTATGPKGSKEHRRYGIVTLAGRRRKPANDAPIAEAWDKAVKDGFDISVLVSGGDVFKGKPF